MSLPPFQSLLDAHGRDVHRFLIATAGPAAAEDCYQETWLAALRAYPQLRDAENLRGWLLRIAHRKAIDHARAGHRAPVPVAAVPEPDREGGAWPPDLDEDLWASVRTLPPKQRHALALRYVVDASYGDLAAAMGISEAAARRNVHEALKRLRTEVER